MIVWQGGGARDRQSAGRRRAWTPMTSACAAGIFMTKGPGSSPATRRTSDGGAAEECAGRAAPDPIGDMCEKNDSGSSTDATTAAVIPLRTIGMLSASACIRQTTRRHSDPAAGPDAG